MNDKWKYRQEMIGIGGPKHNSTHWVVMTGNWPASGRNVTRSPSHFSGDVFAKQISRRYHNLLIPKLAGSCGNRSSSRVCAL